MTDLGNKNVSIDSYEDLSKNKFLFGYFDDWKTFFDESKKDRLELKDNNFFNPIFKFYEVNSVEEAESKFRGSGWKFKTEETKNIEELDSGFFGTYVKQDLIDNFVQAFEEILLDIDMGGSFKKSKLIITDKPQGIFDFGLASLGLFEEQEFFSEKLEKESPFEFPNEPKGIVPNSFVTKNELGDFWYVSPENGSKYKMTQQNKGTQRALLDGYSRNDIPTKYKSFKTKQKKSYLLFKKEGGKAKRVDLYIPMGGSANMKESGMLSRALPVIMAARFFESVGINTRVNATRLYYAKSVNLKTGKKIQKPTYQCVSIKVKDFGEDIDFTKLAISVADNRTFRWGLWKYLPAFLAKKYGLFNEGYGNPIYSYQESFKETTRRFKNWYEQEIEKGVSLVEMQKPLMIFGGLPFPPNEYVYTGQDVNDGVYNEIVKEFYRILDTVDMFYNNTQSACKRIYERFELKDNQTEGDFKDYVLNILSRSYSVSKEGEYADSNYDVDILEEEFDKKIEQVNEFLKNIL